MAILSDTALCYSALYFQMDYCSSALSWVVDTLAQGSTFKPPRPPPASRGMITKQPAIFQYCFQYKLS